MIPALNVSPAPTVSTTLSIDGADAWYICFVSLSNAQAPFDPQVQKASELHTKHL
jgi:hypothetical protein